jgi:hypothetical protein
MMRRLTNLLALAALAVLGEPARAGNILADDFTFVQSAMVDFTINGIITDFAQRGFPVDIGAAFHYDGSFSISQDASGNTIGSFTGHLTGTYLGLPVTGDFSGSLLPIMLSDPDFDGKGEADASGLGGKGKLPVEIHVKDDGKGNVKVTGKIGKNDIKGTEDTEFKKTHDDKKNTTTYSGSVDFVNFPASLDITVDDNADPKDQKKHFKSRLLAHLGDVPDEGTVSLLQGQPQQFQVAVDAFVSSPTMVPEPSTLTLLAFSAAGLVGYSWRRQKRQPPAVTGCRR